MKFLIETMNKISDFLLKRLIPLRWFLKNAHLKKLLFSWEYELDEKKLFLGNEQILQEQLQSILHTSVQDRQKMKNYVYQNQSFCYSKFVKLCKQFLSDIVKEEQP